MRLKKQLIEEYYYQESGYKPFVVAECWQVAKLNYKFDNSVGNIHRIEIHYKTDEVFILINGNSILIGVEKDNDKLRFHMVNMKKNMVYNIPKGTWHCIAMKEDSEIIIVENSNTHIGDFELYELSDKQKDKLKKSIDLFFKDEN